LLVHSLYATFAGRDGLLTAIYESYPPLFDIEALLARPSSSREETVRGIYRAFAAGLERQPRVASAMLADAFSRPEGAAGRLVQQLLGPLLLHLLSGPLMSEGVRLELPDLRRDLCGVRSAFVRAVGLPRAIAVGLAGIVRD
jgi:hypothetical protein